MNTAILPSPHAAAERAGKEVEAGHQALEGTGAAIRAINFDNAVKFTDAIAPRTSIRTTNLV